MLFAQKNEDFHTAQWVSLRPGPHPFSDEAIWHLSGQRAEFAVPSLETRTARTARGLCPALEVVTSYEVRGVSATAMG